MAKNSIWQDFRPIADKLLKEKAAFSAAFLFSFYYLFIRSWLSMRSLSTSGMKIEPSSFW